MCARQQTCADTRDLQLLPAKIIQSTTGSAPTAVEGRMPTRWQQSQSTREKEFYSASLDSFCMSARHAHYKHILECNFAPYIEWLLHSSGHKHC